uniref:Uncharacterized protein n=1 Tax=Lactuca sativa TaxID=4236 RepID=A0A9R1ULH4_LACSA|nr:hypothetical protein LSAT_V11C800433980 [Lactuca sativa]
MFVILRSKRNCTIYMGDTSTTIALSNLIFKPILVGFLVEFHVFSYMSKMQLSENIVKFVNEKFKVTISPNVDFTFVITIIAIIEAMEDSGKKNKGVVQVVGGVTEVAGTILLL